VAGVAPGPAGCPLAGPGYGVDVAFMLFQRRGCGIHVVSAEPERAPGRGALRWPVSVSVSVIMTEGCMIGCV